MASFRDSRTKPSAAQVFFGTVYVPTICDYVYSKYGSSYSNFDKNRNTWRADIAYSPIIEEELILHTKVFIRMMCENDSKHTNPEYLSSLVKMIADYLSAYTKRSCRYQTRKAARLDLQKILWDDFAYIQQMLHVQALKRLKRAERNSRYMQHDKNAANAYEKMKATQRRLASGKKPKQK